MSECLISNCLNDIHAKGYCKKHYDKLRRNKSLKTKKVDAVRNRPDSCTCEDCDKKHYAKGFCLKHYTRYARYGSHEITNKNIHGLSGHNDYGLWLGMKNRCSNPKHKAYHRYGGRGIIVCDRWINSFVFFIKDMGSRPSLKHEIDREDNNGNYEPSNCRWVLRKTNARNKDNVKITFKTAEKIREMYKTKKYTYDALGEKYNLTKSTIGRIINYKLWKDE